MGGPGETGGGEGSTFKSFKIKAPTETGYTSVNLKINGTGHQVSLSENSDGVLEGSYSSQIANITKIQVFDASNNQLGSDCPIDPNGTDDLPNPELDGAWDSDTESANWSWGEQSN